MATTVDSFGVCASTYKRSIQESLVSIIQEITGNRRHNLNKSLAKFLFATFTHKNAHGIDVPYFILGSTQHRTKESIEKEHTAYNFTARDNTESAKLGSRGEGAKLLPFKIKGNYSVWFRINDSTTFSSDESVWGLRQRVQIQRLIDDINTNTVRDSIYLAQHYGDIFHIPSSNLDEANTLNFNIFQNSELYNFIIKNNFQYFQVFTSYDLSINSQLKPTLEELAKMYETNNDIELYYSINKEMPVKMTVNKYEGYGLCPENWLACFQIDWKLGKKHSSGKYWENELRWKHSHTNIYHFGIITSNGSTDNKFNRRTKSLQLSADEQAAWIPDISIKIPLTKSEYSNAELKQLYLFIENDLISNSTGTAGLDNILRNMGANQSQLRYIIEILRENIKNNAETGLHVEGIKRKSTIKQKYAIYEMLYETIKLAKKYYTLVSDTNSNTNFIDTAILDTIPKFIEMDKIHLEKSKKRKKEGILFDAAVCKHIQENFDDNDVIWEDNDATISATHKLGDYQGIDLLGTIEINNHKIRFASQMKNIQTIIKPEEIDKFINTIDALKEKYPTDIIFSYLVVANKKCFNQQTIYYLQEHDINIIIENTEEDIGSKLYSKICNDYNKLASVF